MPAHTNKCQFSNCSKQIAWDSNELKSSRLT